MLGMSETFYDESGWHDISDLHRRVRKKLERFIEEYKNGVPHLGNEWRMPMLVAPYGSGKTTLMRYLVRFCWRKLRVPALLVNLSDIVSYLKEHDLHIHADKLAEVVEEFFGHSLDLLASKLGGEGLPSYLAPYGRKIDEYLLPKGDIIDIIKRFKRGEEIGVLFIDEIEESYNDLKKYVGHRTSPFRGLAEKIRTHDAKIFTILAFGPSTALRESASGPSWRMERVEIPFADKSFTLSVLKRFMKTSLPPDVLELLANSIWWMSKGRVAWIYKIVRESVFQQIIATLNDPDALRRTIMDAPTLSDEIIEGVPLMDKAFFNKLLDGYREYKKLLLLSSILIGPIPESILKSLHAGRFNLAYLPERLFVIGREVVRLEDVVRAFREVLESELESKDLERALSILEKILNAWSRRGLMIYDSKALEELKNIASDYAFDICADNPEIGDTLAKVRVGALNISSTRGEERYVALRPSLVVQIYPPIVLLPLIGLVRSEKLSRENLWGHLLRITLDDVEELAEKLANIIGLDLSSIENRPLILFLPSAIRVVRAEDQIYECLRRWKRPLLIVVVGGTHEENERLARELRKRNPLIFETVASILPLIDRASLYALSLIYNIKRNYNFEELTPVERRIFKWYNEYLRFEIGNAIQELVRSKYKGRSFYFDRLLENSHEIIGLLSRRRGSGVGKQQAHMFYLNAAFPRNIDILAEILEKLNEIRRELKEFLQILSSEGRAIVSRNREAPEEELVIEDPSKLVDELVFQKIKMLTDRSGISFVNNVKKLHDSLSRDLRDEHIDSISKLILDELPDVLLMKDFYNLIWTSVGRIEWLMGQSAPEVAFAIFSEILRRRCDVKVFISRDVEYWFDNELRKISQRSLADILRSLREVDSELRQRYGLKFLDCYNIDKLSNSLNALIDSLSKLRRHGDTIKKIIEDSKCPSLSKCLLYLTLWEGLKSSDGKVKSDGILNLFTSNIVSIYNYVDWLRSVLDKICGNLRKLSDLEDELKDMLMVEKLKEAIINDLRFTVEKGTLYDLCVNLEFICKEVEKLKDFHEKYKYRIGKARSMAASILEKAQRLLMEEVPGR